MSAFIRSQLDELDERAREQKEELLEGPNEPENEDIGLGHFTLGSKQAQTTFRDVEIAHGADLAFKDFRKRLIRFLNSSLPANGIPLQNARGVHLVSTDVVRPISP